MVSGLVRNHRALFLAGALLVGTGCGGHGSSGDADASDGGITCDAGMTQRRVVAYLPLELDAPYDLKSVDYSIVTHVVEHAVCTDENGELNLVDLGKEFPIPNFVGDVHAGGGKAILGLCADPGDDVYGKMAENATARATYIKNVMALVSQYGFDGLDIDWEFPDSAADEKNLTTLVTEMRGALGSSRSLSITGPPNSNFGEYYDFASLMPEIDWFGAQTYSYSGITSAKANPDAPLYSVDGEPAIETSIQYYLGHGVPASQLLMGVVYYGRLYEGANELGEHLLNHDGNDSVYYSAILPLIGHGWTVYRDNAAGVPYLLKTDHSAGILTYDDPTSIEAKCKYATTHCLGGTIVWNLGLDVVGDTQPLLEATRSCR
jgi:chitinase